MNVISGNEEVVHQWQNLTEDQEDVVIVDEFHRTFINEFVTVVGFAFTTSFLHHRDIYKDHGQKSAKDKRSK